MQNGANGLLREKGGKKRRQEKPDSECERAVGRERKSGYVEGWKNKKNSQDKEGGDVAIW